MDTKQTNIGRKSANRAARGAAIVLLAAAPVGAQSRTFTLDADFDSGVLAGVNHSAVPDQLQLDRTSSTFDFVWIANSQRGTLARLDTETGQVLGEYRTAPGVHGRNPSRLAIDAHGNAWTGNRSESVAGSGPSCK
jgi:streptogramin lyase